MKNRLVVVVHGNDRYVTIATTFLLTKQYMSGFITGDDANKVTGEIMQLYEDLLNIQGVTEANIGKFECSVKFGDAFEVREIIPPMIELLKGFYQEHRFKQEAIYDEGTFSIAVRDQRRKYTYSDDGERSGRIDLPPLPDLGVELSLED